MRRLRVYFYVLIWSGIHLAAGQTQSQIRPTRRPTPKSTGTSRVVSPYSAPLTLPVSPLTGVSPALGLGPGFCAYPNLPQYCSQQSGVGLWTNNSCNQFAPIATCIQAAQQQMVFSSVGCPVGSYQCVAWQQQMSLMGCPPGAFQGMCMQLYYQRMMQPSVAPQQSMMPMMLAALAPMLGMLGGGGRGNGNNGGGGNYGGGGGVDPEVASGGGGSGPGGSELPGHYVNIEEISSQRNPIMPPLKKAFPQCTEKLGWGKCLVWHDGIHGNAKHAAGHSCHNINEAIDLKGVKCGNGENNRTVTFKDPDFMKLAICLARDTGNKFQIIFRDNRRPYPPEGSPNFLHGSESRAHENNMHVQLQGCDARARARGV